MNIAVVIFKYQPIGGLQIDMMAIVQELLNRNHQVTVYCLSWHAELPSNFQVKVLTNNAKRNHQRYRQFNEEVLSHCQQEKHDLVFGFNKMSGLDIYYAADPCYLKKIKTQKPFWARIGGRFKFFSCAERAVFEPQSKTKVLAVAQQLKDDFISYYQTPADKITVLPPGIDLRYLKKEPQVRSQYRQELAVNEDCLLFLAVATNFSHKGLDRTINALGRIAESLPEFKLLVVGDDKTTKYQKMANKHLVDTKIKFLGARNDLPELMQACDIFLHPARHEAGGKVLVEALVSNLSIITTDICGYAPFLQQYQGTTILLSPFVAATYDQSILDCVQQWRENPVRTNRFSAQDNIFRQPAIVVDHLENLAKEKLC